MSTQAHFDPNICVDNFPKLQLYISTHANGRYVNDVWNRSKHVCLYVLTKILTNLMMEMYFFAEIIVVIGMRQINMADMFLDMSKQS